MRGVHRMTPTAVVTSCSAEGLEKYGRRFVETFARFWPGDMPLYLVSEDDLPFAERVTMQLDLRRMDVAAEFLVRHASNQRAQGKIRKTSDVGWTPNKIAAGYNFRYDAFRFAKKVFSVALVAERLGWRDRLLWVDADVVTFAKVPEAMLDKLLPPAVALSALVREGYHTETGFVGYNLEHEACRAFIKELVRLYASDEVFALQEWHDGWVFEWLRKKMGVPTHAIPHCSRRQPFLHSEIGKFCDHLKGPNKTIGRTPKHLRTIKDGIPYWS